jgi:hypothetical protein
MNNRQHKKKFKKLRKVVFGDYDEIKGRKIYSYKTACANIITLAYTARPKQKGCDVYSEKHIIEELRLYGYKVAYELNLLFK